MKTTGTWVQKNAVTKDKIMFVWEILRYNWFFKAIIQVRRRDCGTEGRMDRGEKRGGERFWCTMPIPRNSQVRRSFESEFYGGEKLNASRVAWVAVEHRSTPRDWEESETVNEKANEELRNAEELRSKDWREEDGIRNLCGASKRLSERSRDQGITRIRKPGSCNCIQWINRCVVDLATCLKMFRSISSYLIPMT